MKLNKNFNLATLLTIVTLSVAIPSHPFPTDGAPSGRDSTGNIVVAVQERLDREKEYWDTQNQMGQTTQYNHIKRTGDTWYSGGLLGWKASYEVQEIPVGYTLTGFAKEISSLLEQDGMPCSTASIQELARQNNIKNPDLIRAGDSLTYDHLCIRNDWF